MLNSTKYSVGSSPLARGTLEAIDPQLIARGLIPARAGNTRRSARTRSCIWAHPRSRGEHIPDVTPPARVEGSSPLARGTLDNFAGNCLVAGLIPARAGNTPVTARAVQPKRAHPRSRGEHVPLRITKKERMGSSPLARGTPRGFVERSGLVGLIPARAGNTMGLTSSSYAARAHPRSRGEHPRITPRAAASGGSSPLARGTPRFAEAGIYALGLIPARAGNTCPRPLRC